MRSCDTTNSVCPQGLSQVASLCADKIMKFGNGTRTVGYVSYFSMDWAILCFYKLIICWVIPLCFGLWFLVFYMEKLGVRRILVDTKCIFNLIMIARVEDKYYKSLHIHVFIYILCVSVDIYALVCCRVWAKRVKSMIRKKKQYYNVMQAKRQKILGDIANDFLERHTLICFNLFLCLL